MDDNLVLAIESENDVAWSGRTVSPAPLVTVVDLASGSESDTATSGHALSSTPLVTDMEPGK